MKLRLLMNVCVITAFGSCGLGWAQEDNALKVWYRQAAAQWVQALPIGNGRLAAMVFGDVRKEHLQLNEDTVWSGDKRDRSNPEASKSVPEIRRLLEEGHPAEAQALADRTMISIPRALPVYETLGDLWLDFGEVPESSGYRRELDLDTAIASVQYMAGGVRYTREVFASAPCHSIVVHLTADKPGSISFHASMTRLADATTEAAPGRLIMTGQALPKKAPGEHDTGVRFRSEMKATVSGGRMESTGDRLDVTAADSVTLTIVAATAYREKDLAGACARDLASSARPYEVLRKEHVADYQHFFRRVHLELPVDARHAPSLPTNGSCAFRKARPTKTLRRSISSMGDICWSRAAAPAAWRLTFRANGTTA